MSNQYIALQTRNGDTMFAGLFSNHAACLEAAVRRNISLDYIDLSGLVLRNCTLDGASLRHADLRGCDLTSANLSECDLRDAVLDDARLVDACLSDACLGRVQMRRVQLLAAIMHGVSMQEATLCPQTARHIPWHEIAPHWPIYVETQTGKSTRKGCVTLREISDKMYCEA